ncbi:MAG: hypothetical protein AB7E46_04355 [Desulfovibrio sp.]|jgi:hypothetical protein
MQVFALFDERGLPKGFYTPVIHERIPEGAVPISVRQWHDFIRNKGQRRWDGEKVVEYNPIPTARQHSLVPLGRFLLLAGVLLRKTQL